MTTHVSQPGSCTTSVWISRPGVTAEPWPWYSSQKGMHGRNNQQKVYKRTAALPQMRACSLGSAVPSQTGFCRETFQERHCSFFRGRLIKNHASNKLVSDKEKCLLTSAPDSSWERISKPALGLPVRAR